MITHKVSDVRTVELTLPNESEYESFLFASPWCEDTEVYDEEDNLVAEHKTRHCQCRYNGAGFEAFGIDNYDVLDSEDMVTFDCQAHDVERLAALVKGAIEVWVAEYKLHVLHNIGVSAGNDAMQDYIVAEANRLNIKLKR